MRGVPFDRTMIDTLRLLSNGYAFVPRCRREQGTEVAEVWLFGERVACIGGLEAAALFYDASMFRREGALPSFVQKTLTGEDGVQSLDGAAHRVRKQAFMELMTPDSVDKLADLFERNWREAQPRWARSAEIVLFTETSELLCRAACQWAGVPLPAEDVSMRAADLIRMVDGFGSIGVRHVRARRARARSEEWVMSLVESVRAGTLKPDAGTALNVFAMHRSAGRQLLPAKVAAVDLLNVLRPVAAIAYYVAFIALALRRYPWWRRRLKTASDDEVERFVHEVRRFYPLAPFLGARVAEAFRWRGYEFQRDQLVLLDVYGGHHDESVWPQPEVFEPDRFQARSPGEFDLIPQGGGDHYRDHRCAGEWITIAVMTSAARLLAAMEYTMPRQNLAVNLARIPTKPKSGVILAELR